MEGELVLRVPETGEAPGVSILRLLVLMKWVFARLETVWKSTRKRCKRKKRGSLLG